MKKVTEKDLKKILDTMEIMDWCKPVGVGLYKTGDMYHGKGTIKDLSEALKKTNEIP